MNEVRIHKLPKWAQKHISDLEWEVKRRDGLVNAHAVLCETDKSWFTIPNKTEDVMTLWLLFKNCPHAVCSLNEGDTLIVGRKR
jgi:hypothetical protein